MANIIKKLKRKHKRKKMQSQRAKLEQEQRAIQQMSPEEAYQNRLRRHKHDALRRTVMSIVAVAAIATVVLLYVERRSYHNYRILSASEQEDVVSTKYLEMSGKILRYSPDGASLVNSSMDTYWSVLYEMQNPVADVKDDRAVIADQDGTLLEMFDKNGETGSVTTSYNIVKAIAENQTHISDPGYPRDVAVADNGNIMMVAYQYVDGSETTSYVAFYNFGDVGQSEDDRIVSGYTYEGTVIPQIMYLNGGKSLAVRDDGFTLYKGSQIPKEKETVKVDKEIVSTFYDDDIIGLVFKNGNKEKPYTMRVYSTDGNLKFEKDFNIPYTTIKVSDGNILLYNSSQVCVMNSRGVEKYSGTIDGTISDFIKIGWNRYLLVLDSGVDVIKLS